MLPLVALAAMPAIAAPAQGAQLFAPTSFWNAPLAATAPVAADSGRLVAELQSEVASRGAWINSRQYSTPVYTVPATQPTVRVQLDRNYPPLQSDFAAVPLPADATPARGSDAHLTLLAPATDTLWEFWHLSKASDGWHAGWGAKMSDVSTDPGYFPAPVGATGSGLPLIGGLMRIGELQAGHLDHALALAVTTAKAGDYVWPAQRTDGSSTSPTAIPEGTRFRLDPAVDVDALALPAVARMMALAAQRYGIVVRDVSGTVTFYGEDPGPTGSDPYPALYGNRYPDQLLANFPWGRLQAIAPPGTQLIVPTTPAPATSQAGSMSAPLVQPAAPMLGAPLSSRPARRATTKHARRHWARPRRPRSRTTDTLWPHRRLRPIWTR